MPMLEAQSEWSLIVLLLALLVPVVLLFRRVLNEPHELEEIDALVRAHGPEQRDEAYQALARKDGIHPDVADAFEEEIRIRGREIRRKDEERRRRDLEGQSDGFPVDPF